MDRYRPGTPGVVRAESGKAGTTAVGELEDELTGIEEELTELEKEIDLLLEDLVDPKITSISVFFSSGSIRGFVPASLQLYLNGKLLAAKEFEQTDRLVLLRGGAIEVYSGITEPVTQNLAVECFLLSGQQQDLMVSTGKTSFKFEASRARANFLEITLTEDPVKKETPYKLSARHWSREP